MQTLRRPTSVVMTDPHVIRTRETLPEELALEHFFQRPFSDLLEEAKRTGVSDEAELLAMGRVLYKALLALACGEISAITVERRLPRRGEYTS